MIKFCRIELRTPCSPSYSKVACATAEGYVSREGSYANTCRAIRDGNPCAPRVFELGQPEIDDSTPGRRVGVRRHDMRLANGRRWLHGGRGGRRLVSGNADRPLLERWARHRPAPERHRD